MARQTFRLVHPVARTRALEAVQNAPDGHMVTVAEPTRSSDQNAKLWAMLADIVKQKPEGREYDADVWKGLLMQMAGFKVGMYPALDGDGLVITGYRSSKLKVAEMADLIEAIYSYGAKHGVRWSDEAELAA